MPSASKAPALPRRLRPADDGDLPLLYSSWIRSLGLKRPWRDLDRHYHAASSRALLWRLRHRAGSVTIAAVHPEHAGQVFGLLLAEPARRLLHWCYVRHDFRRQRIAADLMAEAFGAAPAPVTATVETPGLRLLRRVRPIALDTHALREVIADAG